MRFFVISYLFFSINVAFSQATAGEYDLEVNEKKLTILAQVKFGRVNKIIPYSNIGVDISYAFSPQIISRLELAVGKANAAEFGFLLAIKNKIDNQSKIIYHEPEHKKTEFKKMEEETVAYINKHKIRGFRFGGYFIGIKSTVFEIEKLGYGNSVLQNNSSIAFAKNIIGLPTFRYQNYGGYLGYTIYNSVNYTNDKHGTGFATLGRHNDYFSLNLDLLVGQSSIGLRPKSVLDGYKINQKTYDYAHNPLGGRFIFEFGIKNIKQILSFDANFEIGKYPYQQQMTALVGLGIRISLGSDVISNYSSKEDF